ncbi:MAG: VPLPA-CTERM sorting domain-containing protein [Nitrospirales bacterium]|nr:VPLPA-CTERM sorting domain-containing protein [Nitrospira sp.]MDR4500847.1 VPLPA-CTERM sorting domain-containing protein [Nitrospirales bacterium]
MKIVILSLALALLVLVPVTGQAATVDVGFDPTMTMVNGLNQTFTVDIVGNYNADAAESLVGGALSLSFDQSIVNVNSVTLGVPTDIGSSTGTIDNGAGTVDTMGFGTFAGVPSGPFTFATIEFESVGFGTSPLGLTDPFDLIFAWANENFEAVPVNATAGSITVKDTAPVPLPAAGWLFLSGLGGLAALRRREVN